MTARWLRVVLSLALLCSARAVAQVPAEEQHPQFDRLGSVTFPTVCDATLQSQVERAVAMLHSFWWEATRRAFEEVAEADARCTIAYWGQAMALRGNPFAGPPPAADLAAGLHIVEQGLELGRGTPRERDYLLAIAAFYRDHGMISHQTRMLAYERMMRTVSERYPEDTEAKIFYAVAAAANASTVDTTFERQRAIGAMLEPLFQAQPAHPGLAHYLIHSYDSPALAPLGLDAARRYAEIAPAVPHAQHMPSHIFVRLGLWDETVAANRRSYDAGLAYAAAHHPGAVHYHEFHAMDYMVYGYLQQGQDSAALATVEEALRATVTGAGHMAADYAMAAMPARYALERSRWDEAAWLEVRSATAMPAAAAVTHFARALGAARTGELAQARTELEELGRIRAELETQDQPYWARIVEIKQQAAAAWLTLATGDTTGAVLQARRAARLEGMTDKHPVTPGEVLPARELYADLLLAVGRPAEARRAYEAVLEREPNRARGVFGAARAAEQAGDLAAARQHYQAYLELLAPGDGTRPELEIARQAMVS